MQTEENALELALMLAASEPGHRPEFFRLLLESTVFVLGSAPLVDEGPVTLEQDMEVEISHWARPDGSPVIPFFSSLRTLQMSVTGDERYIALPARAFFAMTRGADLVLNPMSEDGKEFAATEIEALLSGGVNQLPEQRVVQRDTQVLVGEPLKYPTEMVASLITLLDKHPNVKAAYVALMLDKSADEKPHLIVGIEAEGDFENVVREAGVVVADLAPTGEPVDLIRVVRGEQGLSQYFISEVKPFYERKPG